jgi:hypothetical protein
LEQAEERLKAVAAEASNVESQREKAREALKLADRAIANSKADLAKRLALLALKLARKSNSDDLVNDATLRIGELDEPLTDALRDKARQRTEER